MPNQIYYFDVGAGTWIGTFEFEIRSIKGFRAANIGSLFRLLGWSLEWAQRLVGPGIIWSDITPYPDEGEAGVSRSKVVVSKFHIPLYHMTGEYVLNEDGHGVDIVIKERFGPVPFLFNYEKKVQATISSDGMSSTYTMPLLGVPWKGRYTIWPSRTRVRAVYQSTWGWARETIKKQRTRVHRNGKYKTFPANPYKTDHPYYKRLEVNEEILRDLRVQFENDRDPRAVFAYTYEIMSRTIKEEFVPADFHDPDWVVLLGEEFLGLYCKSVKDIENEPAWKHVYEAILELPSSVIEDMVFSMIAHIVNDLPHALVNSKFDDGKLDDRQADYHRVNDLLEIAIQDIQQAVSERYNPWLHWLDELTKHYDETLTNYGLRLGRAAAWYNAFRLTNNTIKTDVENSLRRSVLVTITRTRRSIANQIIRYVVAFARRWPKDAKGEK